MENANKKTIMIIEDDMFVMDIYKTKLDKEGFNVVTADNGMEGLKKLESAEAVPNLVLLDIIMPYLDGLSVLQKMRESEKLKDVPVILLTNSSQKEEIKKGFSLGIKDYLIKSHFTPTEVMEKIDKYCI